MDEELQRLAEAVKKAGAEERAARYEKVRISKIIADGEQQLASATQEWYDKDAALMGANKRLLNYLEAKGME